MLGGDEHDVVRALAGDRDPSQVQGLCIDGAVDVAGEELAEAVLLTVAGVRTVSWRFWPVRLLSL